MKVLYAIQGTGNGHLSRARDIIPLLQKKKIDLDILVSGTQSDVELPYPVAYRLNGLSFTIGKTGGIDLWQTYRNTNTRKLRKEITELPVDRYNLVINDFEPVSAWACWLKRKPCVGLGHQVAVLSPNAPKPGTNDPVGRAILQKYAPTTRQYGFHFKSYQRDIFTPVIRQEIRQARNEAKDHYTVYLPAYKDEILISQLSKIKSARWEIFSKHSKSSYEQGAIRVRPVSNKGFISSMTSAKGILCGSGFETPAETLYLGKKLMVIPMKWQYEQHCNAASLQEMGIPVIKSLKDKYLDVIREWVDSENRIEVDYPDETEDIIDRLLDENL